MLEVSETHVSEGGRGEQPPPAVPSTLTDPVVCVCIFAYLPVLAKPLVADDCILPELQLLIGEQSRTGTAQVTQQTGQLLLSRNEETLDDETRLDTWSKQVSGLILLGSASVVSGSSSSPKTNIND